MRKNITRLVVLSLLICISVISPAQNYADSKEKIYIHSNHVFYKPGETVFFKLYLVKGKDQTPSIQSNMIQTELIGPSGTMVQKSNFQASNGYAEGSFDFSSGLPGGIYKIKAYTSWMQNEKDSGFFTKEVTLQQYIAPRVLMKLDFPEKGYGPGSAVKANFSMRDLEDRPIKNKEGKYTVSIGGEMVFSKSFKTDQAGKNIVQFNLPSDLKTIDGLLNITVSHDGFTESISRSIPIVLKDIDLQFMPEGGTLVEGLSSNIAFKAVNVYGKAADVKGDILDKKGNKIASFSSYHFGMGQFTLTPAPSQTYRAVITSPAGINKEYELPEASETGVVMQVKKSNGDVTLSLQTENDRTVSITGSTKGVNYYHYEWKLKKGSNEIIVKERNFPAGIAQFTVNFDEYPIAERIIFLNEDLKLNVSVTTQKKKYGPREKVNMIIKTTDEKGDALPANLSLSVVDDKLWTYADDKQDNIQSWLLLSSELKAKVEEPAFYFKPDEPKAKPALDLVMLTHGYRYFDFIEYVVKENKLKYLPDMDNIISGKILRSNQQPATAKVFLMEVGSNGQAKQILTGTDGEFFFSDLSPYKQYYLVAQPLTKSQKITIKVQQTGFAYSPAKKVDNFKLPQDVVINNNKLKEGARREAIAKQMIEPAVGPKVVLNEVVVTALGQTRQAKELGYSVSRISAAELTQAKVLPGLMGKVSGLNVVNMANPNANNAFMLRGIRNMNANEQPLYVVNGAPVDKVDAGFFNTADIETVTVLKDSYGTALFGARAANGVIIVETKKFRNEQIRLSLGNRSYYTTQFVQAVGSNVTYARRFYSPKYKTTETEERTDFRETVYWNPVVQTDKEGKATIEFYNSDASTTLRTLVEGIGFNGKLGRVEKTFAVQNPVQADVKIPPYLTVGDKALLPLVIKNNSEDPMEYMVTVDFPEKFMSSFTRAGGDLAPDSSIQILVPAEALSAASGEIKFRISGQFGKETLRLPINATDKGFPVRFTFSGAQSAEHNFQIAKYIPGTLRAELKVFNSPEGQLLNGIESMLHEPYGCFEQTSSTTYPNVFILKYLREAGKSNSDIEQKALGYIERGYKRLIGYETAENGFEWFGHTPAHEALTAYGLLEFTDMQEFVNVDKNMLERTKKFLMNRRDGKGGFNIASGGYDRFASVPNKVANIYIVYALTQAGMGKEILPEYKNALKMAMDSKDGYQLAMMALSASSMKDSVNYQSLVRSIREQFNKNEFTAQTTVVNSRDASLRVETYSLFALALMRSPNPPMGEIASLIEKVLSEKSYYGYGSTQATVMALQAIVAYSKLTGKINTEDVVRFNLNNGVVADLNEALKMVKEGSNKFTASYSKENSIPYSFDVSYNVLTPPVDEKAEISLSTSLSTKKTTIGETVRMEIVATNKKNSLQPMAIAKIGIPAGLSLQPWQLKEIMDKNQVAYYEMFDNYLVFYWMGFAANETRKISLDLKAEVPGLYKAKASNCYLYYTPEYKFWVEGNEVNIINR